MPTITVTPTPPITPPAAVTICLSEPGTITLDWSPSGLEPTTLTFTKDSLCTKLYIPEVTERLRATSPGALGVKIV